MKVNLAQATTLIATCGTTNTILLRGQPGVGKSSILAALTALPQLANHKPCYIDVANLDLGDIAMPVVDREAMITNYAPNARFGLHRVSTQPVIIMLDELGKATRPVQNMLMPLILERRLGDVPLPQGSIVFATTNLATDGVGDNIQAHALNRMTECVLANPTPDEWLLWAAENSICPEVMAAAREFPQMFDCYTDDPTSDNPYIFNPTKGTIRAFASPRSLAAASHFITQRETLGAALLPALIGTVGESAARDIEAMVQLADSMPRFEQIVAAPTKTKLPKGVSAYYLMAFMLAGRATADNLSGLISYVNRWEQFEARVLFAMTLAKSPSRVGMACSNRDFTLMASDCGAYF